MRRFFRIIYLAPFWLMMGDFSWIGAIVNNKTAKETAQQQAESAAQASTVQQQQFNINQANIKPWLTAGTAAVNRLASGTQPGGEFSTVPTYQFDQSKIQLDPGYAFRTQQGVNALTAAGSAAGNLGSGNLGTALTNYGQQAGSQEYGAAYNRAYQSQLDQYNSQLTGQNTLFNRLSGIAQTGQTANNQLSSAGQNYANAVGNNLTNSAANIGNINMQNSSNIGNAFNNMGNSAANQLMGGLKTYNANNNAMLYQQQQQANSYGFGNEYANTNGYGGVTGGSGAGTDMYAGNLY